MHSAYKKKRKKLKALFLIAALTSCGDSVVPEVPIGPDGVIDQELVDGREIWGIHCTSCHGPSGQGGRGKKVNNGEILETYPNPEMMVTVIQNGKGQGMPAFSLKITISETQAVIKYMREVLN